MAIAVVPIQQGRFTERLLRVGATVFAIGILTFFAARSVNGGLAGILLSGLISSIAVAAALGVVTGMWRESRRMEPRHAVLGGCVTGISLCGFGGVVLCFGNQLLLGALVGGVAALVNHRQQWIDWRQLVGVAPGAPPPPPDVPVAPVTPSPLSALDTPPARAGAAVLALVLVVIGIFFWGAGTTRSLENFGVAGDLGCTAPCGMQFGLWVQVVPDAQGRFVSQPAPGVLEMRLSFHDDEPGAKRVSSADFTLTGPDPNTTYAGSVGRPECGAWTLRLQLDDTGKVAPLCFLVPPGAQADPAQLVLNWGTVVIPLGTSQSNFSFSTG